MGFPGSSAGKESACHAGDPGSIPGWGRSPGEGIGCPLIGLPDGSGGKIPPAMWETGFIQSLHWEGPLEEGMATLSSILAWRNPMDRGAW